MLATGKHKELYRPEKGHIPHILTVMGEPVAVQRDEVLEKITDPVFRDALSIYQLTKLWGNPNGNGWANEPIEVLDAITALELEAKALEHEELEGARNGGKKQQSSDPISFMRKAGVKNNGC